MVFDRLQRVGISLSYSSSLIISKNLGKIYVTEISNVLKKGQSIRIVGDNINWSISVRDERIGHKGYMQNAFGSAVIVQNFDFASLPNIRPQKSYKSVSVEDFIPNNNDMEAIFNSFALIVANIAVKILPYFKEFEDCLKLFVGAKHVKTLPNTVIPLPVLLKNEQKLNDVVDILDHYEDLLSKCYSNAGLSFTDVTCHIGGDQLTRERFSSAKRLRGHHKDKKQAFAHLSPITFELFHMTMNFMQIVFNELYSTGSSGDIGTLKFMQERLSRSSVNADVSKAYDADKDFLMAVTDIYLAEAVMEHFGLDSYTSKPSKNVLPEGLTSEAKCKWLLNEIKSMLTSLQLFDINHDEDDVIYDGEVLPKLFGLFYFDTLNSANPNNHADQIECDRVVCYSTNLIELGLILKQMFNIIHYPDRNEGLRLLKLSMLFFKSYSVHSKYAYEIMRLLVHQQITLSEKQAQEEFYGLFVQTENNCIIPADLQMEYVVKKIKRSIRSMFSGQTIENIQRRSESIFPLSVIGNNFDYMTGVIKRYKTHKHIVSIGDEQEVLQLLHANKPFEQIYGRLHNQFKNIQPSVIRKLNKAKYKKWIKEKIVELAYEIGN